MGLFARTKRRLAEKMGMRKVTTYPGSFHNLCKTMEVAARGSRAMEAALRKNFHTRKIRGGELETVAESLRNRGIPELESGNWDRESYGRTFVGVAEAFTTIATISEHTSTLLLAKIPPVFARFYVEAYGPYKKLRSALEARRLDMEQAKDELAALKETKPKDELARSAAESRIMETTILHDKTFESLQSLIGLETQSQYPLQIQAMHDCLLHLKAARINSLKAVESHLPKISESQRVGSAPVKRSQPAVMLKSPIFSIADLPPLIHSDRGEVAEKSQAPSQTQNTKSMALDDADKTLEELDQFPPNQPLKSSRATKSSRPTSTKTTTSTKGKAPADKAPADKQQPKKEFPTKGRSKSKSIILSIADLQPLIHSDRGEVVDKSQAPSQTQNTKSAALDDADKTLGQSTTLDEPDPPPPKQPPKSTRGTKSKRRSKAKGKTSTDKAQASKQERKGKSSPQSKPQAKSNTNKEHRESKKKKKKG